MEMSLKQMQDALSAVIDPVIEERIKALGLDRSARGALPAAEDEPKVKAVRLADFFAAVISGDDARAKALSEGSDSAGGFLVPEELRNEVLTRAPELSELFPFARRVRVGTNAGSVPRLATDISISWSEAENEEFNESDPVFSELPFAVKRANAVCYASRELLADSGPGVAELLTRLFAEATAAERDRVIAVGDGSSEPEGVASATLSSVAVGGSVTFAKLVEIECALAKKYRRSARWMMSNANVRRVMSLVDSDERPLFVRDLAEGSPARLLGYPVSQQDDFPDGEIYFGDLAYYYWFDREQMGIETTTTGGSTFMKHQIGVKVWERVDGRVALAEAFVKGTGITG
jgi:HK97 family phage major capsid protein